MHTTTNSLHDVIVVGARPAGAATAMLLARAGLDVLVLDRSRYGSDTMSTHALMRTGVLQLHRWGLLDRVIAAGTPAVRRTVFDYGHDQVTVDIKPSHGIDALYAPRRTVLDPILIDAAAGEGATVRYGITVTDVVRDAGDRVVGVRGRDDTGRHIEPRARWVVGADGAGSTIARSVGAPVEHSGTAASAFVYGYWDGVGGDAYEWSFRPDASSGVIPTKDGQACVFAGGAPARIRRGGLEVFHEVLAEASPAVAQRVQAAGEPSGMRRFLGRPGFMRLPHGPGWALVGDASHWKDPIGAHGLTDAMRDAELLARALVTAFHDPAQADDALTAYHKTRDQLSRPLFDAVDEIAAMRWSDDEIPTLLRRVSSAMSEEVEHVAGLGIDALRAPTTISSAVAS
jgi:2-polyprenyl-6-methoxyphenol hydroxylase-like FAD-dependent oxidoreductase